MLGRLFKQQSMLKPPNPVQNGSSQPQLQISSSYEDSYTREILYGLVTLKNTVHVANSKKFRLVVSQDGGNLRSKQVLFDSAANVVHLPGAANSVFFALPDHKVLPSKQLPSANELNDYMFGRGLPSSESHTATKVHHLPLFSGSGSLQAVLVTKLFLVTDKNGFLDLVPVEDPSWAPQAALPLKERLYSLGGTPGIRDLKPSVNSRFAIGIAIPYSDQSLEEVVFHNWEAITHYLIIVQKLVTKKLLAVLRCSTVNCICPYINNKRILFPTEVLQHDADLPAQLHNLVRLVQFGSNTPRLILASPLMKYSFDHPATRFKSIMVNWALEVTNWLELKDGRNPVSLHLHSNFSQHYNPPEPELSHTFLASLMALVLQYRGLLAQKPFSTVAGEKEITRLVVMTGNSMVAKKLIFILNGVIPNVEFEPYVSDSDYDRSLEDEDEEIHESYFDYKPESRTESRTSEIRTPAESRIPENTSTTVSQPIPIKRGGQLADSSDELLSVLISSNKGWEVGKGTASVSFTGKPSLESSYISTPVTAHIPIHGKPLLSTSSSMAYLSLSLNSSFSLSASNYSFSKLGGSFLDKWRSSLVHDPEPPELLRKPSVLSLSSPSPLIDQDWGSPRKSRTSRTQHMLGNMPKGTDMPLVGLKRLKTAVVVPLASDHVKLLDCVNQKTIQEKCSQIMNLKIEYSGGSTLEVQAVSGKPVYKQKPLLANAAFLEEFRPEYAVQLCPLLLKLEPQVLNAMKNDLIFFQNHCGLSRVTTRTIFISLRAREIKLMEMRSGERKKVKTSPVAASPITSYFQNDPERLSYRTSIKKVFTPHQNAGDKHRIDHIEHVLEKITETVAKINDEAHVNPRIKTHYNQLLSQAIRELLS